MANRATYQICGLAKIGGTPRSTSISLVSLFSGFSKRESRTMNQMEIASTKATIDEAARLDRQPISAISNDKGAWPRTAPIIPIIRVNPVNVAKRCGGNQMLASFRVLTQANATPTPTRRRPR